jgi:hypothetical protein
MISKFLTWAASGLKFLVVDSTRRRLHESQLRAMSARELADLGIGASQIPSLLRNAEREERDAG